VTPEPSFGSSDEITAYVAEIIVYSTNSAECMANISTLSQMVGDDPYLVFNETWIELMTDEAEELHNLNQVVKLADPPLGFEPVHDQTLFASEFCADSAIYILLALDSLSGGDLDGAVPYFEQSAASMNRCSEEIRISTEMIEDLAELID
jgi:hypothetical protein